ncbi:acetaldehyde dehydrogenase (acetylating) [Conexibacter sp. CPCC 206217]|uniref:acetaldehyde dehydrogenase (acetylating) n=1 Tax=Conexibacter sp. CPCC 206217 TaxID=3064574 RepID=UPI0027271429|nr:acetaldehyde dehydrogenase (acetylating) [Conexibacter sp. CPCC 206217]MDO8213391.1 acetaldehyde dehydrogenase (acetylating) [Conexibacter sp. CPCC 206217]
MEASAITGARAPQQPRPRLRLARSRGHEKLRVGIIGTGNIGTDLLLKVQRSPLLACELFAGRSSRSAGMRTAQELGVETSDRSIDAFLDEPDRFDLVFDATSAIDAKRHYALLAPLGIPVIDLTPAKLGKLCIPALNLDDCVGEPNLCMVTCGGQAAVPLANCIVRTQPQVEYVEIVSTSASRSVGPATRINIDEYLATTEAAVGHFCGVAKAKTILIVNPSNPPIKMQNTVFAKADEVDLPVLRDAVHEMVRRIQRYVPGYRMVMEPLHENGRIAMTVQISGAGDYLPEYAGNLDIITCAAVAAAEENARVLLSDSAATGN